MSDMRPKIHVFLGAPPPPLESVSEAGGEPGRWSTVDLCWEGGRLRPRQGEREGRTQGRLDRGGDATSEEPGEMAHTSKDLSRQQNDHENHDDPPHPEKSPAQNDQSDAEEEDLCSQSVKDYLDSCFPAGQPDPGPESYPDGSEPQSDPVGASLSLVTEYLSAWTVSQALVLRGRLAAQPRPSPEIAPPPPHTTPNLSTTTSRLSVQASPGTPPRHTPTPGSTSTPPRQTPGSISTPPRQTPGSISPPPRQTPGSTSTPPRQTPGSISTPPRQTPGSTSTPPRQTPGSTSTPPRQTPGSISTPPRQTPGSISTPPRQTPGSISPPPRQTPGSTSTPPRQTPGSISTSSPELYSPAASTPSLGEMAAQQGSMELFHEPMCQRLEEGGVMLEATPDGVLCSQVEPREAGAAPGVSRPPGSLPRPPGQTSPPAPKRSRVSPTSPRRPPESSIRNPGVPKPVPCTLLARCSSPGVCYSVLVAVVHPCHLKEIRLRRGAAAGTSVPLASVVVTDQSGVDMTVVMWRKAAFWVLTVYPGDVLMITGVRMNEDRWRGETVLQSTYTSRLLNLGQITSSSSLPVPQNVNGRTLRSLCSHLYERRPLLVSLPPRVPQDPRALPHARLRTLRPDTLVHALLRVTHTEMITVWHSETEGTSRTGATPKAVLTVEQGDGHQGAVVIWGAALAWLTRINRNKDVVWEFCVLLVRESTTFGLLELHSTPWSTCEPLFPYDTRAQEFYRPGPARPSTSLEMDLHTLLSQKYTGDVELRVEITTLQFQGSPSQDALQPLDCDTPLESILETVSGDVTFTGCGRCAVELDTDANGIYCPCYPCLPHTGVRRYYRPAVLTVRQDQTRLCVQVPPVLLQKILCSPPDKLNKTVAPGSDVRYAQLVADRIHFLLSLPRRTFVLTVHSHFLCDENSVATAQDFLLLDLQSA